MEETEKPQLGSAVQADLPKEVPSMLRLKERDEVTREQSWRNSLPGGEPGAPANAGYVRCTSGVNSERAWGPLGFLSRNKLLCG